ncbi:MAG: hypothetical protein HY719_17025, partial [Planctomycetes bacterium]|nr:hypothetical protein [Planctomycetota bacterium]
IVPLAPHLPPTEAGPEPRSTRLLRGLLVGGTLVAAVVAAVAGLALSAGIGAAHAGSEPLVPYSPCLFIGGVMLWFASAIVYETFGAGRAR